MRPMEQLPNPQAGALDTAGPRAWRQSGFTLMEALVVIAIVGIVAGLAAPNFVSFIGTMHSKSAAFDLISDLTLARSEALKRNVATSVAPLSGFWANGWEVLAGGEVLRHREKLGSTLSIGGAPSTGVVFQPNGRLANTETATANVAWSITSSTAGVTGRCVIISPTGSARSKTGACA
jgi:type IV fimbrial biogenesis protein FimT